MKVRLIRLTVLALAVSVATAACGKYSIASIRSAKAFQDANNLYKKQDYEGAIPRYEAAITHNPDLGFAYFFLGHSHDMLYKPARKDDPANFDHLRKAEEHYVTAVKKLQSSTDPNELKVRRYAYEYLIALYGADKLNNFEKAIPVAKELIALDPKDASTYRILARLYEDQGLLEDAERELLRSIDAQPNDPIGYQMLAGFYNDKMADFDKTMDAWYKRAAIEPNNPEAWHTIGIYFQSKVYNDKRLPRAQALEYVLKGIEAEDKALAINPDYHDALVFKNILMKQQALYEKDPAKIKQLLQESDVIFKRAEQIRAKESGGK
jgi:tetratricopeptide (TPR) repeat protein